MGSKRQLQKRAYRKARSGRKAKIARGGTLEPSTLWKYNLNPHGYKRLYNKTRQEIISEMFDEALPPLIIKVPKIFCMIQDPKGALDFLNKLDDMLAQDASKNVFISHWETEHIGLSASFLFDSKIKKAEARWKKNGLKMRMRGMASSQMRVNNFLAAFGLLKELGINPEQISQSLDWAYERKFRSFKRIHSAEDPALKSNASTELAEYFNSCLSEVGFRLTMDGRVNLINSFSELLGNAEEHSGVDSNWSVLGCFERSSGHVMFAIINSGLSIYETLSGNTSTTKDVLERIEKVILDHRSFIAKARDAALEAVGLDEDEIVEPIWNVMALQEGISSKRTEDAEGDTRGKGMMDVLQFISEMHERHEDACLVIISGHSYILVDYEYPITQREIGPKMELWRTISFNKSNDLHTPQDPSKVAFLKTKFPGTIITGRFKLRDKYVKQVENLEDKA